MFRLALSICVFSIAFAKTHIVSAQAISEPLPDAKIGEISVKHEWIPMRDGVRLSAYLFFPARQGTMAGADGAALRQLS